MRTEVEKYELIERYLQGELKGDELVSFQHALQNNADFAKEVEQHKQLMSFIEDSTYIDIKAKFNIQFFVKHTVGCNGSLKFESAFQ